MGQLAVSPYACKRAGNFSRYQEYKSVGVAYLTLNYIIYTSKIMLKEYYLYIYVYITFFYFWMLYIKSLKKDRKIDYMETLSLAETDGLFRLLCLICCSILLESQKIGFYFGKITTSSSFLWCILVGNFYLN